MKSLKVTWKGITPLIMHSCRAVNPLCPVAREMKKYTSKKNKTEEDLLKIADLEWEAGAYWDDEIGLYIPGENVVATLVNGGKANKKGTDIQKYVNVTEPFIPLFYGEKLTKEQLVKDYRFRDSRIMVVQRSRVVRTRPRFNQWQIVFHITYNEEKIDLDTIVDAMDYSGAYVGLCDSRPRYGKFVATVEELG